jgi:hypothetical protein
LPPGFAFCGKCGMPLEDKCTKCGARRSKDSHFAGSVAKVIEARQEETMPLRRTTECVLILLAFAVGIGLLRSPLFHWQGHAKLFNCCHSGFIGIVTFCTFEDWYIWRATMGKVLQRMRYAILGVDSKASGEEIRHAYRIIAGRHHPDNYPKARRTGTGFAIAINARTR